MNVYDYIKNYAKTHGIKNYALKCKYITKADTAKTLRMAGGIAFFYKLFAEGEIADAANIVKKFCEVITPTDFYDLSPAVEVVDFGTLQKVSTDFIFTADNTLNVKLYEGTADAMFANITNFCAMYMQLIPMRDTDTASTDNEENIKININNF